MRELLRMPSAMIADLFEFTAEEVTELRAAVLGLSDEAPDRRRAWLTRRQLAELFPDDTSGTAGSDT